MIHSHLDRAISDCEQAIATKVDCPDWQAAFQNLGNILQSIGQFEAAVSCHSLASETQLDLAAAYCELGELYLSTGNRAAALTAFQNAVKHQPNSVKILANLAQLYGQSGQDEAEIVTWYRVTQLNPDFVNPSGYYKLGKALQKKGKLEQAANCLQKALSDKELFIPVSYELGKICLRQKKLEQAKSCYQQILAIDSSQAEAQYRLGTILLQQQSLVEAIDCFEKTIDYAPQFPGVYYDLVKTYLRLQRWDEAIATCHAIINLIEPYPWVYSFLGKALRAKGKIADAAASFQQGCQGRGWQECVTNNYLFTQDIFSEQIPIWKTQVQPLLTGKKPLALLEIGSYQGMSTCWLLDKILVDPADSLVCIEEECGQRLRENIAKTGSEHKVTLLEGDVPALIDSLQPESFNLINLNDKQKLANNIERKAILAWKLLKSGGLLVFNDYGWTNPAYPQLNPTQGIERFLTATKKRWKLIHRATSTFQVIVRKL